MKSTFRFLRRLKKFDLVGHELIPLIKEKERNKKLQEEKLKAEQELQMKPKNGGFIWWENLLCPVMEGPKTFTMDKKGR